MRLALVILLASVSHGGVAAALHGHLLRGAAAWARSLQQLEADELSPSHPGGLMERSSEVESVPPVVQEAEIEHTASAPGGWRESGLLYERDLRTVGRTRGQGYSRVTTRRAYNTRRRLHSPT